MKKNLKWVLIALSILIIGLILYFIIKQSLREEADLIFPETVIVQNKTDLRPEKIAKALLYNIFDIDTVHIVFSYMPSNLEKIGNLDIKAYVTKNPYESHNYFIFLSKKLNSSELKKVLSHEVVHINQMERGDLIQTSPEENIIIWKGDTINYMDTPYDQRPHEKESHMLDDRVLRDLEKIWYK